MTKKDKEEIKSLISDSLHEVVIPVLDDLYDKVGKIEENVGNLERTTDRIERKLDAHQIRMDRHGKQLEKHERDLHSLRTKLSI